MSKILFSSNSRGQFESLFIAIFVKIGTWLAQKHRSNASSIAVYTQDYVGLNVMGAGVYERDNLEVAIEFIRQIYPEKLQQCVLDVGANIGNHAVYFDSLGLNVHAIEPNPIVFELLQFNSRGRKIACHSFAATESEGEVVLQLDCENSGKSSITDLTRIEENFITASARPIDNVIDITNSNIGIMKIDVEGAEKEVVLGSRRMIERNRPIILFEQNETDVVDGSSPTLELLRSYGYDFALIRNNLGDGSNFVKRFVPAILRLFVGRKKIVEQLNHLEPRFYEMIIAYPMR